MDNGYPLNIKFLLQLRLVKVLESIPTAVKVTVLTWEPQLAMFLEETAIMILYVNVLVIVVMMHQKAVQSFLVSCWH